MRERRKRNVLEDEVGEGSHGEGGGVEHGTREEAETLGQIVKLGDRKLT